MLGQTRLVFFGTPLFALPSLTALAEAGAPIVGVVTQPDRPAGRGVDARVPPVKVWAETRGIPVFQPTGLRKEENRSFLGDLRPDLLVVVAYGKILPKEVLDLPRFGAVNVHASLLPKYRGPAPIPAAILAGDAETGVTIMKLDQGMDTGPLLAQTRVIITPDDTTGTLSARLAPEGARLLVSTLAQYLAGTLAPVPQPTTGVTVCRPLKSTDGLIDWSAPARVIERLVRAYNPWPHAYTFWGSTRLLIHLAQASPAQESAGHERAAPGTVFRETGRLHVTTGEGRLIIRELQREGRVRCTAPEFVRGYPQFVGTVL